MTGNFDVFNNTDCNTDIILQNGDSEWMCNSYLAAEDYGYVDLDYCQSNVGLYDGGRRLLRRLSEQMVNPVHVRRLEIEKRKRRRLAKEGKISKAVAKVTKKQKK